VLSWSNLLLILVNFSQLLYTPGDAFSQQSATKVFEAGGGVVIRLKNGKRRGYCRRCAAFVAGEISEADAPRLRNGLTPPTGWMKPFRRVQKPESDV
jgi:hypothetical protein